MPQLQWGTQMSCVFFPTKKFVICVLFSVCRSKSGVLKSEFKNDVCAANCDVDLNMAGPLVKAAAVFGYNGWLAGYQTKFDSQKSKITANNFALGYSTSEFILHTNV